MVTTFRAALAFSLLVGFYAIVLIVVAAAVALDVLTISQGLPAGPTKAAVIVTIAAGALLRALWIVSRRQGGEQPGVVVSADDTPQLWQHVNELAEQVGTRPPDEIRLVGEVNASVSEDTTMLGLRATRRRMYIGIPLLQALTVGEMRAVLGHELGHYSGAHTRLGAPVYRGRIALIGTIEGLGKHPVLQRIFRWYFLLFMRISQAVSRRQELEADEFAVAISGREAAGAALRGVYTTGDAWDSFLQSYGGLVSLAKARPRDFFDGFQAFRTDPVRQREISSGDDDQRSPYDSHPSLSERLAAIAVLPEPAGVADQSSAMTLLRDPDSAARDVADSLWTEEVRHLPVLSWAELVERGMFAATNAEALADLSVAGQRIVAATEPCLDAALEAILRGRASALHDELIRLDWAPREDLLAVVLGKALEGTFIENGLAAWTLSWSAPAALLDKNGDKVDLQDSARSLIADPATQVPATRDWLTRNGIDARDVPAVLQTSVG